MNAREIAEALGDSSREGHNWRCRCPIHNGVSLTLADGQDGKLLVTCFAGCSSDDVLAALGQRNLLRERRRGAAQNDIVAAYGYYDEAGKLLFQVCRLCPKSFRQRRPDGVGGWTWNTNGVRKVPYRLPDVLDARAKGNGTPPRVYIVEGEKDADRLFQQWGLLATTNPGGAGKWRKEYNQYFSGFDAVILPDNDEPGRKHARDVAANLLSVAACVRILELPGLPGKGDVSDWLSRNPDAWRSDLETMVESTEPMSTNNRATPPPVVPFSEDALALQFTEQYRDDLRFLATLNKWYRWSSGMWCREETLEAFDLARAVCRSAAANPEAPGREISKAKTVAAVVNLARADRNHATTHDQWDADDWLLNPHKENK
jgi:putative DNA primase/helicase